MSDTEYGYDKLSTTELNKVIADLCKDVNQLLEDKKQYNSGMNDVIKENKNRIKTAIAARSVAYQNESDSEHEKSVKEFLEKNK